MRLLGTAQLVLFALLPTAQAGTTSSEDNAWKDESFPDHNGALRCTPRRIRGGLGRLLDSRGELRLFFPCCLAIAAPVLLFRLKREGFSRCSVAVVDQGLLVRGRR